MFNFFKNKNTILLSLISPALLWGNYAYAENDLFYITKGNVSELELIAVAGYSLIYYIGLVLAFVMFFGAIKRLMAHGRNPNDPRSSAGGVLILMIGFAALTSLQSSVGIGINTFTGSGGNCFVYHNSVQKSSGGTFAQDGSTCFDAKNSEITTELRKKLEEGGKAQAAEKLYEKLNVLFAILQAVGLAYFIKGIYTMKAIVEQTTQSTYGNVFVMLAVSSLVMDMPNTLQIIINTAKSIASVT